MKPGSPSRSQEFGRRSAAATSARASTGTKRAQTRLASGSAASTAKASWKPAKSISVPATTGPTTLASAGASPSQEKMRFRSVVPLAMRPAERWIAIKPKLVPAPVSSAATQRPMN